MAKFFVPTAGVDNWRALLADPEKQWRRGYSAFAAASAWEEAQGLPREVASVLGDGSELLLAIPENKLPLPGGQRESQCDVFAIVRRGDETVAPDSRLSRGSGLRLPSRLQANSDAAAFPHYPQKRKSVTNATLHGSQRQLD